MPIALSAIIDSVKSLTQGGFKITLDVAESEIEQVQAAMAMRNRVIYVVFQDAPLEQEDKGTAAWLAQK